MIAQDATVETPRLILRPPVIGDFDRYAELFCHPTAAKIIGGGVKRGDAWRRFLQMPGAWAIQGFAMFSLIEKQTGLWVGQAGPWQPDGWPGTEIGYALHQEAWGKGYATEACGATIDWAFDTLGWTEVIHCIASDNTASQAVARRLGSRNSGPGKLPPPLDDHAIDIWRQSRVEWKARRATVVPT